MIKTPKYWETCERFEELVPEKTLYGNTVMIPKNCLHGWETIKWCVAEAKKLGLPIRDGSKSLWQRNPIYYDLERVYHEVYDENDLFLNDEENK